MERLRLLLRTFFLLFVRSRLFLFPLRLRLRFFLVLDLDRFLNIGERDLDLDLERLRDLEREMENLRPRDLDLARRFLIFSLDKDRWVLGGGVSDNDELFLGGMSLPNLSLSRRGRSAITFFTSYRSNSLRFSFLSFLEPLLALTL